MINTVIGAGLFCPEGVKRIPVRNDCAVCPKDGVVVAVPGVGATTHWKIESIYESLNAVCLIQNVRGLQPTISNATNVRSLVRSKYPIELRDVNDVHVIVGVVISEGRRERVSVSQNISCSGRVSIVVSRRMRQRDRWAYGPIQRKKAKRGY